MAITVTHDNTSIECTKAVKCTNKCYIHCLDSNNNLIASFDKIEDFEAFAISGGAWSEPETTEAGNNSSARGNNAIASGVNSTAIGQDVVAGGNNSIAIGQGVTANYDNQVCVGRYNENTNKDNIFEVGAGDEENRRTAFSVDITGDAEFGGSAQATDFYTNVDPVYGKYKSFNDLYASVSPAESGWMPPNLNEGVIAPTSSAIRYRKRNGVIHIFGNVSINNLPSSGIALFTLPANYRPANGAIYHIGAATGGKIATFHINTNGVVTLINVISPGSSTPITGNIAWVSMAISFPL